MNLLKKSILIVAIITIIGVGAFFAWHLLNNADEEKKNSEELTVEELLEISIDTEPITTNLADGSIIKIDFKIVTDSKNSAEEMEKLKFRVESTIIKSLNGMKKKDVIGLEGFTAIQDKLKNELNKEFVSKDMITKVYIVDLLVQ
ncbi:flagellar basal body-associated FliL family protein [Bacillus sp. T3]|uniref:flagellar basal body-associated FliL family protein n=1 Tax=Bacillus sp. T3 TaxID=467262 RepID=UPI0029813C62|nr:flagellar basal body-associated FliL family protein [Bacillus sp. T3]